MGLGLGGWRRLGVGAPLMTAEAGGAIRSHSANAHDLAALPVGFAAGETPEEVEDVASLEDESPFEGPGFWLPLGEGRAAADGVDGDEGTDVDPGVAAPPLLDAGLLAGEVPPEPVGDLMLPVDT